MKTLHLIQKTILLFWLAGVSTALTATDKPVKIAIIGDTDNYKTEIDTLTVKLSAKPNIVLLERTDIDYILKEHKIALSNISRNSIRLGQLLGADGILLLKEIEFLDNKYLSTRLVAVKPGVILNAFIFPIDKKSEALDWTQAVETRLAPLFAKLAVARKDAIPVSLLNLSFPLIDSGQKLIQEKELNAMLAHRLIREKKVFVNERWNMGQVDFEKDLNGDLSSFWTGAYIVGGNLKQGKDSESISANLSIRSPKSKPKSIVIEAKNIIDLSKKISDMLIGQANVKKDVIDWDQKLEAAEYRKEAEWAFNNNLNKIALQAADSAWALGDESVELAILRMKICGGELLKDTAFPQDTFGVGRTHLDDCEPKPRIDSTLYGLEILNQLLRKKPKETIPYRRFGTSFMKYASLILAAAHKENLHQETKYEDKTTLMRYLLRDCFKLLIKTKEKNAYWHYAQQYACFLFFSFAPYWCDDTTQMIDLFQWILSDKLPKTAPPKQIIRSCMASRKKILPTIIIWDKQASKKTAVQHWREYVISKLSSQSNANKIDGFFLFFSFPSLKKAIDLDPKMVEDFLWGNREKISQNKDKSKSYCELAEISLDFRGAPEAPATINKHINFLNKYLAYYFDAYKKKTNLNWNFIDALFYGIFYQHSTEKAESKSCSSGSRNYHSFCSRQDWDFYKKESFKKMFLILNGIKTNDFAYYEKNKDFRNLYDTLLLRWPFDDDLKTSAQNTTFDFPFMKPDKTFFLNSIIPKKDASNTFSQLTVKDNKLWVLGTQTPKKIFIASFSPSGEKTIYWMPNVINKITMPNFYYSAYCYGSEKNFTVTDNPATKFIFFAQDGKILTYNENSKQWNIFADIKKKILTSTFKHPYIYVAFGERYSTLKSSIKNAKMLKREDWEITLKQRLKTSSGIMKINMTDGTKTILASCRRKPGKNILDNCQPYEIKSISPDKNKENLCIIGTRDGTTWFAVYNFKSKEWQYTPWGMHSYTHLRNRYQILVYKDSCGEFKVTDILSYISDKKEAKAIFSGAKTSMKIFINNADIWNNLLISIGSEPDYYPKTDKSLNWLNSYQDQSSQNKLLPIRLGKVKSPKKYSYNSIAYSPDGIWLTGFGDSDQIVWYFSKDKILNYCQKKLFAPEITPNEFKTRSLYKNPEQKKFKNKIKFVIKARDKVTRIRYTLDGSLPNIQSAVYKEPIEIAKSTIVKARSFKEGHIPSDVFMVKYIKE